MLHIEETPVQLSEFVCEECELWFLSKFNNVIACPHCGGMVATNGEFKIKNIEIDEF